MNIICEELNNLSLSSCRMRDIMSWWNNHRGEIYSYYYPYIETNFQHEVIRNLYLVDEFDNKKVLILNHDGTTLNSIADSVGRLSWTRETSNKNQYYGDSNLDINHFLRIGVYYGRKREYENSENDTELHYITFNAYESEIENGNKYKEKLLEKLEEYIFTNEIDLVVCCNSCINYISVESQKSMEAFLYRTVDTYTIWKPSKLLEFRNERIDSYRKLWRDLSDRIILEWSYRTGYHTYEGESPYDKCEYSVHEYPLISSRTNRVAPGFLIF